MAKFNAGDQIMVNWYGSTHWDGPYTVTRMVNKKKSYSFRGDTWYPGSRYVEYIQREQYEMECYTCGGIGTMPNEAAGIMETCKTCTGTGKVLILAHFGHVANRSDKVCSAEHYETVVKPAIDQAEENRKKGIQTRDARIRNHLQNLVDAIIRADDPVDAAAEYLKKWGYAPNSKEQYWNQSELYQAASLHEKSKVKEPIS